MVVRGEQINQIEGRICKNSSEINWTKSIWKNNLL